MYATLTFIFIIDEAESELAVLDLIQVLVEVLDKCFENVCELDLIFNPDKVRSIENDRVIVELHNRRDSGGWDGHRDQHQ